jgi:LmbE family N-acetylglucosaminyl deacetylase
MPQNRRSIFLAPHPDDAVLSCGGTIYQLARHGQRPIVITIFGGDRPAGVSLSNFACGLHARWQLGEDAPASRRDEDRAALDHLGAYLICLPFADAVYRVAAASRQHLYASEEAIFGEVQEGEIVDQIAEALRARIKTIISGGSMARVFAPLSAGHHVDHQIVRASAEKLNYELIYYEDYPYAEDAAQLAPVWGPDQWAAESIALSDEALRAKTAAFLEYRSQISTFYKDTAEVAPRLRRYAEQVGVGKPVERFWRKQ